LEDFMFERSTRRLAAHTLAWALVSTAAPSFVGAAVVFSSDFESDTVGNRPAWTSVTDSNTDSNIKFRVDNTGDPFGTGSAGVNKYLHITDTTNIASGNATVRGLADASNVATLSFDLVEPVRAGTGTRLYLHIGQTSGTLGTAAEQAYQIYFSNGFFNAPPGGAGTGTTTTTGAKHSVSVVMNYSASSIDYAGVGGANQTLASGKFDLHIDGVKVLNNYSGIAGGLAIGTPLSAFNFQSFTSDANQEVNIDNVVFQTGAVVPEPVSTGAAMLGLGIGAVARRRR
jgi:hypothetical protein